MINWAAVLLSPPSAFLIFFAVFTVIYFLAGALAAKGRKSGGKLTTYACGENIDSSKFQFGYEFFFLFAIFFTIMHVTVLVIATLPGGTIAFFGLFYLIMISIAVATLITRNKGIL